MSFEIKFRLITKCKNKDHHFNSDQVQCTIKECDNKSRKLIETINSKSEESSIDEFRTFCIRTNDGMIDLPLREEVRIIDVTESENDHLFENNPVHCNLIDKEARNVFSN